MHAFLTFIGSVNTLNVSFLKTDHLVVDTFIVLSTTNHIVTLTGTSVSILFNRFIE